MEFPMKIVVVMLLMIVTLVILLALSGAWSGKSNDMLQGIFNFFKDLGVPIKTG